MEQLPCGAKRVFVVMLRRGGAARQVCYAMLIAQQCAHLAASFFTTLAKYWPCRREKIVK